MEQRQIKPSRLNPMEMTMFIGNQQELQHDKRTAAFWGSRAVLADGRYAIKVPTAIIGVDFDKGRDEDEAPTIIGRDGRTLTYSGQQWEILGQLYDIYFDRYGKQYRRRALTKKVEPDGQQNDC